MSEAALHLAASLVSDRGPRLGDLWVPWQHDDARAILTPANGDPRQHWLGRPKGGSKDTDVAAFVLGWLVEDAGPLDEAFVIGADKDQGNRLLNRARGFIQRSGLGGVATVEASSIVNPRTGARAYALAADVAGGEGLLSPLIVVEELPNWADTTTARNMWTVAFSGLPKWPGMTFVVIGHAGGPEHWSYKLLTHARGSSAWRVVEIPGPLPWVSPADLDEQRALLLPSQFARRHLNRWTSAEGKLSTLDDVRACMTAGESVVPPQPGCRYVISADLGVKHDRSVVCVTSLTTITGADGQERTGVCLDRIEVWEPKPDAPVDLGVVEAAILELHGSYNRAPVVMDPWQGLLLAQNLRAQRVPVREFTFSSASVSHLATTLFRLLRDRLLDLPDDEALADELANVDLRETSPGVYRMEHASDKHDDRAVALALGAHTLLSTPASRKLRCR